MAASTALTDRIQSAVVRLIADVILFNHAIAQREGLGPSDGQFLTLLQTHGPMTAGELSARTGLTTGSTTGVIDRLEAAGLARRARDPEDRRRVIVTPDESGIARRMQPHYAGQAAHLAGVLDARSDDELRVIATFLEDLVAGAADTSG